MCLYRCTDSYFLDKENKRIEGFKRKTGNKVANKARQVESKKILKIGGQKEEKKRKAKEKRKKAKKPVVC